LFEHIPFLVGNEKRTCAVYVPPDLAPPLPQVLFLHGAGERDGEDKAPHEVGIGPAIAANPERFPCLVIMPRCPADLWWTDVLDHVDAALEMALGRFEVDPERVYLTGMSMGGYATWTYGARHTDRFAALLPVCGGGRLKDAEALARLPIWATHGGDDEVVPPDESRRMVQEVRQAGGDVQYTEYTGVGHNSWDQTYCDAEMMGWLLGQRREPAANG